MTAPALERTFIMIKPDGVARRLVGRLLARFEAADFALVAMRCGRMPESTMREFYREHEGKPFYESLVRVMSSGPVAMLAFEREDAVSRARQLVGKTDPADAAPGSIRADFGLDGQRNTIHASDSPASAERELRLMLPEALPEP
jgi:nucleoside-diphosphate kinase